MVGDLIDLYFANLTPRLKQEILLVLVQGKTSSPPYPHSHYFLFPPELSRLRKTDRSFSFEEGQEKSSWFALGNLSIANPVVLSYGKGLRSSKNKKTRPVWYSGPFA